MPRSITFRLCLMMFLEYAVRGMWYPFLANFLRASRAMHGLGFSAGQTGWVLGFAAALGAATAPFIGGRIADRYVNAEKALAVLHCIAATLLFLDASSIHFGTFFLLMIFFSIAYVPTQSLTNSLALTHLTDREHTYPRTRMWGTIGWIVTSALFTYIVLTSPDPAVNISRIPDAMRCAAIMAICYAGYAFFLLPKTPPPDHTPGPLLPTRAFALLRHRSVLVLTLIAMPLGAIHTAYYLNIGPFLSTVVGVPLRMVGPTLGISQVSEVTFLFMLGPLLRRFGYNTVLTAGAVAQMLRFVIFAIDPPAPVIIVSLALHGVAFACFFTTAILYIERIAPPTIRHSAQTVFGIVLLGLGPALAGPYSQLFDQFVRRTAAGIVPDYRMIWWTQATVAAACAMVIALFFRQQTQEVQDVEEAEAQSGAAE
jgi:nucleoside transporter